jgi:hypothetical protein
MNSLKRFIPTFLILILFSATMAYLESVVVVYLRSLYAGDGSILELTRLSARIIRIEIFREAATIIMLMSISMLAGHSRMQRMGVFSFCFGLWDIFYYLWLKILLDWPAGLLDVDILFLIPGPWIGPVLAPLLISAGLIGFGILLFIRDRSEIPIRNSWLAWVLILGGCVLMVESFLVHNHHVFESLDHIRYPWELFISGMAVAIGGAGLLLLSPRKENG